MKKIIDASTFMVDPDPGTTLLPAYDCGDGLHFSPAGYAHLAERIDLSLFEGRIMMMRPSLQSRMYEFVLRLIGMKKRFSLEWMLSERRKSTHDKPPPKLRNNFRVSVEFRNKRNVWSIAPKDRENRHHILYLHGGAYVQGFQFFHWPFFGKLAKNLDVTVIVPDYPLAPEHRALDVIHMVRSCYSDLIGREGAGNVTLMGDSAGGGLSLALAQTLCREGIDQPSNIILLSPWLDVTMSNPGISSIDADDPVLGVQGLIEAGRAYASNLDPTHHLVSPIYGALGGLAPMTLFIGTHDLLVADCRRLKTIAQAESIDFHYHEYDRMLHDWMCFPMPESRDVLNKIAHRMASIRR